MQLHQVVRRPLMTEKGTALRETARQYLFEVDRRATKPQIQTAVETMFQVKVENVRTLQLRGKMKRVGRSVGKRSNWKKAYITLAQGSDIEFFEGV